MKKKKKKKIIFKKKKEKKRGGQVCHPIFPHLLSQPSQTSPLLSLPLGHFHAFWKQSGLRLTEMNSFLKS